MEFRWDKWFEGALVSGLITLVVALAPILEDGNVTKPELLMLLGTFVTGVGLYIKQHPPLLITAEMVTKQAVVVSDKQDAVVVEKAKLVDLVQKKDEQAKP